MESRLESVSEYSCVMESEVRGPKKTVRGTYHLWSRRPDCFRLRIEKGDHSGSEIALNGGNRVKARPGGFLKRLVSKTMSKEDSRLRTPRGAYPWDSRVEYQCRLLRERIRLAPKPLVKPVVAAPPQVALELSYRDPARGNAMREVWTVDTQSWLLTGQDIFENGKQVERVRYRDFRLNPGLEEDFFDL